MKIKEVTEFYIKFDNNKTITFNHTEECCEFNYADFEQLDDLGRKAEFNEKLDFEFVEDSGFRFGNKPYNMFFIPCYSNQNGYYSSNIEIYFDNILVCQGDCELIEF